MPFSHAFLPTPPASKAHAARLTPRCASTHPPSSTHPTPPTPAVPPLRPAPRPRRRSRPRSHTNNIHRHAKAGDLAGMQRAVAAAVSEGFVLNAVNYTTIANAHATHGDPAHVFAVLSLMRARVVPPTNVTLRVAVKACDAWRDSHLAVDALLAALKWAADAAVDPPDARTWNLALRALARKGAFEEMELVLRWMRVEGFGIGRREDIVVERRIPAPTVCSYNTCIHALGTQGRFADALRLFAEMLVRRRDDNDLAPDVVTYNTLLELAVSSQFLPFPVESESPEPGRPSCQPSHFVAAVSASMRRHGVTGNITTETLVLRLLTRKHSVPPEPLTIWIRARIVLDDAANVQYQPDKKGPNRNPCLSPAYVFIPAFMNQYFDALITAFARAADMNGVSYSFDEMISRGLLPDMLTIRALLVAASYCGDVPLATKILDVTHEFGFRSDEYVYTSAISACARSTPKDPETADLLLNQALERGTTWTSAMINATISSYGDNISKAIDLWKKLRTCPDEASRTVLKERVVYDSLMRVCGRSTRPDLALRIFYAAKKASHISVNTSESRIVFNAFRRGLQEANAESEVEKNALKNRYLQHLKTECGVNDELDLPVERIRIKF